MKIKYLFIGVLFSLSVLSVCGCGSKSYDRDSKIVKETKREKETKLEKEANSEKESKVAGKEIKTGGLMTIEPDRTPLGKLDDGEGGSTFFSSDEVTSLANEAEVPKNDSEAPSENYEAVYSEILLNTYNILTNGEEANRPGETGISEACLGKSSEEILAQIGFDITDINEDGVWELIIYESSSSFGAPDRILAIYSVNSNNEPVLVIEGWSGNKCYLLDDGCIYSEIIVGTRVVTIYRLAGTVLMVESTEDQPEKNKKVLGGLYFKDFQ